jgi:hypothetical protein
MPGRQTFKLSANCLRLNAIGLLARVAAMPQIRAAPTKNPSKSLTWKGYLGCGDRI